MTTPIQLYHGAKDNKGELVITDEAVKNIQAGIFKEQIKKLRTAQAELAHIKKIANEGADPGGLSWPALIKKQDELVTKIKSSLPAVTWSGTFTTRKAAALETYSGLICLDIDKLAPEALTALRTKIIADPYTHICFISPSGNGLKVIIRIADPLPEYHKDYFLFLQRYYKEIFNAVIDPSGKDICRLCFLTYDPSIYINDTAKGFSLLSLANQLHPPANEQQETVLNKKQETELTDTTEDLYSVIHFTDKISSYQDGNYNNYIHLFACNANRKGFTLAETLSFAIGQFGDIMPANTIKSTVNSAFNNNPLEHGKFKKQNKLVQKSKSSQVKKQQDEKKGVPGVVLPAHNHGSNADDKPFTKFWQERTITKGRGEDKVTFTVYEMLYVELSEFLFEQGFHLIETGAAGWQLCHSKNGIIKTQTATDVAQFLIRFSKNNCDKKVQEMVRKNQGKIFNENELRALDYNNVIIKADTETESYFYFENGWVTVTKDGITQHPYKDLKEYIWASNKNKHSFTAEEPKLLCAETATLHPHHMTCEFAKFVYYAAYNPNSPEEKDFSADLIETRFQSFCCSIGFMLDGYKHPANRKAIFALDHKVGDKYEKNGRSGKSIIPHACGFIKKSCTINGKTHDPRYAFRYEPITADAQIVNFNDMKQSFDVEEIFELIADDYNVLRRNNGYLFFKYENSPKVWYSANGIPRGEGGSYRARMHLIEFSDYFNPEYTPYDEFGHGMFSSAWDDAEWNRFYNFMLWCVQCYKENGLVQYPKSNIDERRLVMSVQPEFIDIIENPELMPRDKRFDKAPAFNAFNELLKNNNEKMASSKAFLKATQDYCKARGLFFNIKKNGKRDYTNNKDHYTISTTSTGAQADMFEDKKEE